MSALRSERSVSIMTSTARENPPSTPEAAGTKGMSLDTIQMVTILKKLKNPTEMKLKFFLLPGLNNA